jgi:hypothetical protein
MAWPRAQGSGRARSLDAALTAQQRFWQRWSNAGVCPLVVQETVPSGTGCARRTELHCFISGPGSVLGARRTGVVASFPTQRRETNRAGATRPHLTAPHRAQPRQEHREQRHRSARVGQRRSLCWPSAARRAAGSVAVPGERPPGVAFWRCAGGGRDGD